MLGMKYKIQWKNLRAFISNTNRSIQYLVALWYMFNPGTGLEIFVGDLNELPEYKLYIHD